VVPEYKQTLYLVNISKAKPRTQISDELRDRTHACGSILANMFRK
jgi:hypothetical protein